MTRVFVKELRVLEFRDPARLVVGGSIAASRLNPFRLALGLTIA